MIQSFACDATGELFEGESTARTRKLVPVHLRKVARRKLDMVNAAKVLMDLRQPPGNRLEQLSGDRKGQHSIRINEQYRVCFRWTDAGPEDVEIVDYH